MNAETDAHGATYAETIFWKSVYGPELPPAYDLVLIKCAEGVEIAARSEHVSAWWPAMGAPAFQDVTHWADFPLGPNAASLETDLVLDRLAEQHDGYELGDGFTLRKHSNGWSIYLNGKHVDCWKNPDVTSEQLTAYKTLRLAVAAFLAGGFK